MITQGPGVHLLITAARRKNSNHWRSEKTFSGGVKLSFKTTSHTNTFKSLFYFISSFDFVFLPVPKAKIT